MRDRSIAGTPVSAIGLGGMPMSIEGRPDEDRSVRTIHAALDAGVTFIDTADAYHLRAGEVGHNERLIAKGLATYGGDTSHVLVATKGGHLRPGDGTWTVDGSPAHLRQAVRGVAEGPGRRRHRPVPVPPARPEGSVRRVHRGAEGAARRGQGGADRDLQRDRRADRPRALDPRRGPPGQRAEPVLAVVPVQRGRAGALRAAGHRVPALEPVRREQQGRIARCPASRLPGGRRRPRRVPAAGHAGLDAGQGPGGHPDPRRQPARVHHRLGPGRGAGAQHRGAGPARPGPSRLAGRRGRPARPARRAGQ